LTVSAVDHGASLTGGEALGSAAIKSAARRCNPWLGAKHSARASVWAQAMEGGGEASGRLIVLAVALVFAAVGWGVWHLAGHVSTTHLHRTVSSTTWLWGTFFIVCAIALFVSGRPLFALPPAVLGAIQLVLGAVRVGLLRRVADCGHGLLLLVPIVAIPYAAYAAVAAIRARENQAPGRAVVWAFELLSVCAFGIGYGAFWLLVLHVPAAAVAAAAAPQLYVIWQAGLMVAHRGVREVDPRPGEEIGRLLDSRRAERDRRRRERTASHATPQVPAQPRGSAASSKRRNRMPSPDPSPSALTKWGTRDLSAEAAAGRLVHAIARDRQRETAWEILNRTQKASVALTGVAGAGKTAFMEDLALSAHEAACPAGLRDARFLLLDLDAITAGTAYRGMFEERLGDIIAAALRMTEEGTRVILCVDELHKLVSAGSAASTPGASEALKPALARGLTILGATTRDEFTQIQQDPALERRFTELVLPELSVEDTIEVARAVATRLARNRNVVIEEPVITAAAKAAARYITTKANPDKTLDVLDIAASRANIRANGGPAEVTVADIAAVIKELTGIEPALADEDERGRLMQLEAELAKRVIGQEHAVREVAQAWRTARLGFANPHGPRQVTIFAGPSGTGKTELAKALAVDALGSEMALIRIDMGEYSQPQSAWRMFGSPSEFKASEKGGILTEALRRNPESIVLLDEAEKAHADIWDGLLTMFDEGYVRDGLGHEINARAATIVITTNLGSRNGDEDEMRAAINASFRPELVGRVDAIVCFHRLTSEQGEKIVRLKLDEVAAQIHEAQQITLTVDDEAVTRLADAGLSAQFGARPLDGVIKTELRDSLANSFAAGFIGNGDSVRLTVGQDGALVILRAKLAAGPQG
jgi:ATP-dependent Clp protease ATP-binding subunit ClpA